MKNNFKTYMQRSLLFLSMLFVQYVSKAAPPPVPITITGATAACVNDVKTYSVSPAGGTIYRWSCNTNGFIYATTTSTGSVQWTLPGTGQVFVYGINATTGDTVETGSLNVNVYALPETYLTASALMGCQMVGTADSTAQPQPPGILTSRSGCINTCENSTVTYYAHDAAGSTYTWLVSGAVSYVDMGDSCIVTWGAPGAGTVSVTTTNVHGCRSTLNICIKVVEGPKAVFTTLPDSTYNYHGSSETVSICAGGKVQFIDISTSLPTSPIVTCLWDFGDGTFRTTSGPTSFSHKYIATGTYTARLVVRNSCGCTDTASVQIEVGPCEYLGIDCPSVLCENGSGVYNLNPSVPCTPYAWTVKGGTITSPPMSPTLTVKWDNVDASGFGYIIFDGSGCPPPYTGKTTVKVPIILSIGKITGPSVICTNSQGLFSMPEWPTTDFNWTVVSSTGAYLSYPDQRNQAIINTRGTTGTIILKVNYKNTLTGCGGVAYDTIDVVAPETIIGPVKFCLNDNGNWHLSGGARGDWRLVYPDGSDITVPGTPAFGATLNQVGNYTLSVSGLACVPDPIHFSIEARPAMPAYISGIDSPCANVPYNYVGAGIGEGSTFGWAVSSGSVSPATGDSTKITFTGSGPYTIKTWRISGISPYCTSDTLFTVVDNPHPAPVITGPTTVCGSSTSSYVVSYKKGETYEYEVIPATAGSVSAGGAGTTPTITWNNPPGGGSTSVTLRVKLRKCATTYTADLAITVVGTPLITLTPVPDTVCSGDPVTLTVSSTPSISTVGAVNWTFGDGTTATGTSLVTTHAYTNPGSGKANFAPFVVVTDINGCVGSSARAASNVWIRPLSVANVTPAGPLNMCAPGWSTNLYASISSGPPVTAYFQWFKIGTGPSVLSGATASTLNVTAGGLGEYYCVVTNSDGCTDTTNVVKIDTCGGGGGCTGRTVSFATSVTSCGRIQVNATVSGGSILYSEWETSPDAYNVVSTLTNFQASYPVSGLYDVKYRVFFLTAPKDTCVIEFDTSVIVPYVAKLRYAVVCTSGAYNVTVYDNSDFFPTTPPTSYVYTIQEAGFPASTGTGGVSFTKTGIAAGGIGTPKIVYLSVTISDGVNPPCTARDTIVLPVLPIVNIINNGFNPACEGDGLLKLQAGCLVGTGPATFHWDFGDFSESDLNPVDKIYDGPGRSVTINVTATNEYGCTSIWPYNVTVATNSLNGFISHLPSSPCEGENVTLTYNNISGTPTNFKWYKETEYLSSSVGEYEGDQPCRRLLGLCVRCEWLRIRGSRTPRQLCRGS
ncbi:MAG: PKD domain-containing protein [Chitinophagaceae bacterium]